MGKTSDSTGAGWIIIDKWMPSNTPSSSMMILPPPPSSAGVPSTRTVRPASSATRAKPRPAPSAEAAIMLCPQAWPTPGKASYSAQIPTVSGPEPYSATNAVSSPPTPASTVNPASVSRSAQPVAARSSSNASSGSFQMRWDRPTRSSRACSTSVCTEAFMVSRGVIVLLVVERRSLLVTHGFIAHHTRSAVTGMST